MACECRNHIKVVRFECMCAVGKNNLGCSFRYIIDACERTLYILPVPVAFLSPDSDVEHKRVNIGFPNYEKAGLYYDLRLYFCQDV